MSDPCKDSVFAAVMAAGAATRFGSSKQLAEIEDTPLVQRALELAVLACGRNTTLVVGHDWRAVIAACDPLPGFFVRNNDYADGLGTSIAQAVRSMQHAARAIIVVLADQAMITAAHLQALQKAWSGADDEIVATAFAGTIGAPVLFPRGCFDELMMLEGDAGGRHLLSDQRFSVRTIAFEPAAIDVDTPEDLRRISRSARS
jgi:molybdenum cofactor cytidylyltransferase